MRILIFLMVSLLFIIPQECFAQDTTALEDKVKELTQMVKDLKATVDKQQEEIADLKKANEVKTEASLPKPPSQTPLIPGKFTPEIGAVADVTGEFGNRNIDHERINRLNLRELELVLGSNVDPFSRLDATIAFTEDNEIDLEEAYLTRFGLPFNTTARIGRFLPKIGKMLPVHRDSIDTVDEPLVIQRYFGDEGMHKTGVDFTSILNLPLPSVHQVTFGVLEGGNGDGGTVFGNAKQYPTLYAHLKNYLDITDVTNFELGTSYAVGSNDNNEGFRTNIVGIDATLRHIISPNQEMKLQGETYYVHRNESTDNFDGTTDPSGNFWGGYGLFGVRLSSLWGTGFRFDCVEPIDRLLTDPNKAEIGYTGYLTFYQSEFARWRALFSRIYLTNGGIDDRVFLQGTFAIGEHKHKLQ